MNQVVHFITGKGGTGKSLIAAGLALREARAGKSTLLVELGERSFYKDFFGLPSVGYKGTPLAPKLDVALWSGPECLREYAQSLIKVESIVRLFFENTVSRSLIDIAPGLAELAILGKATAGARNYGPADRHDVIVIDAYATGHFLSLMRAPYGMSQAVSVGPMGQQSRSIDAAIRNPEICHVHVVALPEEMPVQETRDLVTALQTELSIKPSLILNKMIAVPENLGTDQNSFAQFLEKTKSRQDASVPRLRELGLPLTEVPLILSEDPFVLQNAVADALAGAK